MIVYRILVAFIIAAWLGPTDARAAHTSDRIGATPCAAGDQHTFVLHSGKLSAFGADADGRLATGLPAAAARSSPIAVSGFPDAKAVATGYGHTLVLTDTGEVWAVGKNDYGQQGDGTVSPATAPKPIVGLSGIVAIVAGPQTSFAISSAGRVYGWGRNDRAQLGLGHKAAVRRPTLLPTPVNVASLAAAEQHTVAIDTSGRVWSWGANTYGQLGDGTLTSRLSPVLLPPLATTWGSFTATKIAVGASHTLALDDTAQVWAWGRDHFGQLCDDDVVTTALAPLRVGVGPVVEIAAGEHFSLFRDDAGAVLGCGLNASGQLGDGTTTNRFTPAYTRVAEHVARLAAGKEHAFAIDKNGQLFAWGANPDGRLGVGSLSGSTMPTRTLYTYPYKLLLLLTTGGVNPVPMNNIRQTVDTFAADLSRMSYGKLQVSVDIAGPYVTSSAALGCGFSDDDKFRVREYAAAQAVAAGHKLASYAHFISWPNEDLVGCKLANQSGGIINPLGWDDPDVQGAGMTWLGSSYSVYSRSNAVHEILHGMGLSHLDSLSCAGPQAYPFYIGHPLFNPACLQGWVGTGFNPLGIQQRPDNAWAIANGRFDCAPPQKEERGWYSRHNVINFVNAPPGDWAYDLAPSDSAVAGPWESYALRINPGWPFPLEQYFYLEYRKNAHLGLAPGFAATPGVFLYLGSTERGDATLVNVGADQNNIAGQKPLATHEWVEVTPRIRARIAAEPGDRARILLRVAPELVTQPMAIDAPAWSKRRSWVSDVDEPYVWAPDNTASAERVAEDLQTGTHGVSQTVVGGAPNRAYEWSVYLKRDSREAALLTLSSGDDPSSAVSVRVDLGAGTLAAPSATGRATYLDSSITPMDWEWYRVTLSGKPTTLPGNQVQVAVDMLPSLSESASYAGDGDSGLYVWGGLLREAQNRLVQPSALESSSWIKNRSSIAETNTATTPAPDGSFTAELVRENTATGSHGVYQNSLSTDPTQTYTFTVYLKPKTRTAAMLMLDSSSDPASSANVRVDLAAGTIVSTGKTGNGSVVSGNISPVANGWYKVVLKGAATTIAGAQTYAEVYLLKTLTGSVGYTGDGASGLYVWGADLR